MASRRLIWVDLEVRILRLIALFFLSHYKTKIGAKPKEVAGEVGFICYPATTFVRIILTITLMVWTSMLWLIDSCHQ